MHVQVSISEAVLERAQAFMAMDTGWTHYLLLLT